MLNITKVELNECKDLAKLLCQSYPGTSLTVEEYAERIEKTLTNPTICFYSVHQDKEIVGGMRYLDYTMNLLQKQISVGGIGNVGVSLTHKKEKVAFQILQHFLNHYRSSGASMVLLYPFHPEFYKKMGFGFGTPMNQFKLQPSQLPSSGNKSKVSFLGENHAQMLTQYYNKVAERTNGLIQKGLTEFENLLKDPNIHSVAYFEKEEIQGYLAFRFEKDAKSFLLNDLVIQTCLFDTSEVFLALCAFLNSQNDQIRHIIFNTQDPQFHFAFDDPRNNSNRLLTAVFHETNTQGIGIMYRVINIPKLFEDLKDHNFAAQTCRLKLQIKDSFLPENEGSYCIQFTQGKALLVDEDASVVTLSMDISDFSSLMTCAVDLRTLHRFGRAQLSDEAYLMTLQLIFSTEQAPICLTAF